MLHGVSVLFGLLFGLLWRTTRTLLNIARHNAVHWPNQCSWKWIRDWKLEFLIYLTMATAFVCLCVLAKRERERDNLQVSNTLSRLD